MLACLPHVTTRASAHKHTVHNTPTTNNTTNTSTHRLLFPLAALSEGEPLVAEALDRSDFGAPEFLGHVVMTLGKALELARGGGIGAAGSTPAAGALGGAGAAPGASNNCCWFAVAKRRAGEPVGGDLCLGFQELDGVEYAQAAAEVDAAADAAALAAALAPRALHVRLHGLAGLLANGLLLRAPAAPAAVAAASAGGDAEALATATAASTPRGGGRRAGARGGSAAAAAAATAALIAKPKTLVIRVGRVTVEKPLPMQQQLLAVADAAAPAAPSLLSAPEAAALDLVIGEGVVIPLAAAANPGSPRWRDEVCAPRTWGAAAARLTRLRFSRHRPLLLPIHGPSLSSFRHAHTQTNHTQLQDVRLYLKCGAQTLAKTQIPLLDVPISADDNGGSGGAAAAAAGSKAASPPESCSRSPTPRGTDEAAPAVEAPPAVPPLQLAADIGAATAAPTVAPTVAPAAMLAKKRGAWASLAALSPRAARVCSEPSTPRVVLSDEAPPTPRADDGGTGGGGGGLAIGGDNFKIAALRLGETAPADAGSADTASAPAVAAAAAAATPTADSEASSPVTAATAAAAHARSGAMLPPSGANAARRAAFGSAVSPGMLLGGGGGGGGATSGAAFGSFVGGAELSRRLRSMLAPGNQRDAPSRVAWAPLIKPAPLSGDAPAAEATATAGALGGGGGGALGGAAGGKCYRRAMEPHTNLPIGGLEIVLSLRLVPAPAVAAAITPPAASSLPAVASAPSLAALAEQPAAALPVVPCGGFALPPSEGADCSADDGVPATASPAPSPAARRTVALSSSGGALALANMSALPPPLPTPVVDAALGVGADELFELLFADGSPFMAAYWAAEELTGVAATPWAAAAAAGAAETAGLGPAMPSALSSSAAAPGAARRVAYVKPLRVPIPMAPKRCNVNESQSVVARAPGAGWAVRCRSTNDAPRGDCFVVDVLLAAAAAGGGGSGSAGAPRCRLVVTMEVAFHRRCLGQGMIAMGAEADARRGWEALVAAVRRHAAAAAVSAMVPSAAGAPARSLVPAAGSRRRTSSLRGDGDKATATRVTAAAAAVAVLETGAAMQQPSSTSAATTVTSRLGAAASAAARAAAAAARLSAEVVWQTVAPAVARCGSGGGVAAAAWAGAAPHLPALGLFALAWAVRAAGLEASEAMRELAAAIRAGGAVCAPLGGGAAAPL